MPTEYFQTRERAILGSRYDALYAHAGPVRRGVTVNAARLAPQSAAAALAAAGIKAEPSPFSPLSFYLREDGARPGAHPYHHAGVYYVQEPSASAPAGLLRVRPGDYVLDLCAAPGGKSSQLAAALGGEGLLVANEYDAARAVVLRGNLERMGFANTVVLNEATGRIAAALACVFDKVLVDAPCSGEGMFRKEPQAERQHSPALVAQCAALGRAILDDAAACVKPGGLLCYSTCTFASEENEMQISAFLDRHAEFSLVDLGALPFGSPGEPGRCAHSAHPLEITRRIYPCHGGEGHFMALLQKREGAQTGFAQQSGVRAPAVCEAFLRASFPSLCGRACLVQGARVSLLPAAALPAGLKKLRVLRAGVEAGEVVKGRFEPAHALFMAFGAQCENREELTLGDARTAAWLHGEELAAAQAASGFAAVLCDGFPLGFGKCSGGRLKNRYPKGLRTLR